MFRLQHSSMETHINQIDEIASGYSVEVMPKTASKIDSFRDLLPKGTNVYIANIEDTPFDDMIATAGRLRAEGFEPMPHIPARLVPDRATLENWLSRYREEAGVRQALLIAGGVDKPRGEFDNSMQLMETELFDRYGFKRLHVAGHPEGNRDIDRDGTSEIADKAALWKQAFSVRTDAEMAMVTQFCFDATPMIHWVERLRAIGVSLPVHAGIAGPAKLQTLLKYGLACGVGPSMKVLKKRASDFTKLMLPYEPTEMLMALAQANAAHKIPLFEKIHFFPLGGIRRCVEWAEPRSDSEQAASA
jgi:methylenetetrahydrofolate reductase (NADPH)